MIWEDDGVQFDDLDYDIPRDDPHRARLFVPSLSQTTRGRRLGRIGRLRHGADRRSLTGRAVRRRERGTAYDTSATAYLFLPSGDLDAATGVCARRSTPVVRTTDRSTVVTAHPFLQARVDLGAQPILLGFEAQPVLHHLRVQPLFLSLGLQPLDPPLCVAQTKGFLAPASRWRFRLALACSGF